MTESALALLMGRLESAGYDESELRTLLSDGWSGDDLALFKYKSVRFGYNAASRLILAFKTNDTQARDVVLRWLTNLVVSNLDRLDQSSTRYIVALPRSTANEPNQPCEWIAAQLAEHFTWLEYLPQALVRTEPVRPAHSAKSKAERTTIEEHKRTIRYAGPALRTTSTLVVGLNCEGCHKQFKTAEGLRWHVENNRYHAALVARDAAKARVRSFLLLDDVITLGATSQACRELLIDAGASQATGIFVGKTV